MDAAATAAREEESDAGDSSDLLALESTTSDDLAADLDDGMGDDDPDAEVDADGPRKPRAEKASAEGWFGTARLVATIVKSFIGSGVLFLPSAFAAGGYVFSVVVMVVM